MKCTVLFIFLIFLSLSFPTLSQENSEVEALKAQIHQLERSVFRLQNEQRETQQEMGKASQALQRSGLSILLFGFFCAWWAKSTGRCALQWFLFGALFHVFTAIALLIKTERGA
jgi:hypothetical protein